MKSAPKHPASLTSETDEHIVKRVQNGEVSLFAELIRRHQASLQRYVEYLSQDPELSQDVVQESFIKAYTNLQSFRPQKSHFSNWLFRIAHNQTMNSLKREKKYQLWPDNFDAPDNSNIEEDLILSELRTHTQDCLKQLPMLYREPIVLFYFENKSYTEISQILRIPIGTIGTRINRGKATLQKICQKKP